MKGNDGTGNTTERDEWETPQWLWNKLNKQYKFKIDCCAVHSNCKCAYYPDFLKIHKIQYEICWMNPPFSKAKEMFEHFFKVVKKGVAIYRFDNPETKLWQMIYNKSDWIFVFNKRIDYEGMEGKGSRFPSALCGIGVLPPKDLNGTVLTPNNSGDDEK